MLIYYFNEAVCNAQIIGQWWLWSILSLCKYLFLVMNVCFPFILKKLESPIQTNDWHIPYPLAWREGYHTALQSIIISLSLCHQEVHHVQKCKNLSLMRWSLNIAVCILRIQLSETTLEVFESFVLLLSDIMTNFE